jgi:hypothetical protein
MGLFRRSIQKSVDRLDDQYWWGLRELCDVEDERGDYGLIDLPDSDLAGLAFVTNRRIIVAKWGLDRVAYPLAGIPFYEIAGAQREGRRVAIILSDGAAKRSREPVLTLEFQASYPAPLAERWWAYFYDAWQASNR